MKKILYIIPFMLFIFGCKGSKEPTNNIIKKNEVAEKRIALGEPFKCIDVKIGMSIKEATNVLNSIGYSYYKQGNDILRVQNTFEVEGYSFKELMIEFKNGKCYSLTLLAHPYKSEKCPSKLRNTLSKLYASYPVDSDNYKMGNLIFDYKEWKDSTYIVELMNNPIDNKNYYYDDISLQYYKR